MSGRFVLCFLVLTFLTMASGAQDLRVVKVVYHKDNAPASWDGSGPDRGYEPAIVDLCLARLGLIAEHEFLPWPRAQLAVESGDADLMVTTPTDERFLYGIFGKEKVVLVRFSLFTHKTRRDLIEKAEKFTSLGDLKAFSLVDYTGNGWTKTFLVESAGYRIIKTYDVDQIPVVLKADQADFTVSSPETMRWAEVKTHTLDDIAEVAADLPQTRFHYVFIVSRKSPWAARGLVKGLDNALVEIKKSGEWAKAFMKYDAAPADERTFRTGIETKQFYTLYDQYPEFSVK